jgi:hypothetical protein
MPPRAGAKRKQQQQSAAATKQQRNNQEKKEKDTFWKPLCQEVGINLNALRKSPHDRLLEPFKIAKQVVAKQDDRLGNANDSDEVNALLPLPAGWAENKKPTWKNGYKLPQFKLSHQYWRYCEKEVMEHYTTTLIKNPDAGGGDTKAGKMVSWDTTVK